MEVDQHYNCKATEARSAEGATTFYDQQKKNPFVSSALRAPIVLKYPYLTFLVSLELLFRNLVKRTRRIFSKNNKLTWKEKKVF